MVVRIHQGQLANDSEAVMSPQASSFSHLDRRSFLENAAAVTAAIALPGQVSFGRNRPPDLTPIFAQIEKRHDEAVQRLQEWIRQPSIAAENKGVNEGCALTMRMLSDAGFDTVTKIPT